MKITTRPNRLIIFISFIFLLSFLLGCPMLPLDVLNNPVDPEAEDYQGGYSFLVTFDSQGGSTPEPAEKIVYEGNLYGDFPEPINGILLFGGWWTEPGGNGNKINEDSTVSLTKNLSLYAHWGDCVVTFDSQGATTNADPTNKTVTTPATTIDELPTAPEKSGYIFGGWFTEEEGDGSEFTASTGVTGDITVYAKWSANTYTVTLDNQSGTGGTASVIATYDAAMPTASVMAPTKTGYIFGGYYDQANGAGTQYYTAAMASAGTWDKAAAATLYAKWTANTYTVTLDRQSGTGGTASVTATYDAAMPTASAPARTGYTFGGYYDEANGGGTQYYTAAMASAGNWDKVSNTTLYAKWTALEVGEPGPAGGLIFYDKGSYSDGWRYLEAAPYGWYNGGDDPSIQWGGYGTLVGGTSTAVGTGAANTEAIVEKLGAGTYAAKACADYSVTVNGVVYDDWYLPSKDGLNLMYQNLHRQGKGGFSLDYYWGSSENSISNAWWQYFGNGSQGSNNKNDVYYVRAVRAF